VHDQPDPVAAPPGAAPDHLDDDDVRVGSLPAAFRRWREARVRGSTGSSVRIRTTHRHTRETLRWALAFLAGAALAAGLGAERWLPLHLFLAGGVGLAISAVTLMLTVTWSAAPAPPDRWVQVQRSLVAGGTVGVAVGREADLPVAVAGVAGVAYLLGIALLGVLLVVTVIDGVERRFDVAVAAYVSALVLSVLAIGVGIDMAVHEPNADLRAAHVTLNLLGYVGLVIGGTLPFFGATVGRSRMARRATPARLGAVVAVQVLAVLAVVVGVLINVAPPVLVGLGLYGYGILVTLAFMPALTRRQIAWAGPRLLALWAGTAWWAAGVFATAYEVVRDDALPFTGRWLLVVVVGGYAQILWGALAYLLPMLRGGGHHKLSEGFAATRSWLGLAAVNLAAVALAVDQPRAAAAVGAVGVVDGAWRAGRVGLRRLARPEEHLEA
jgi:nitrite reductase (NO-forming)